MQNNTIDTNDRPPPQQQQQWIGRSVQKEFIVPGTSRTRKWYHGRVLSYDARLGFFLIRYEDDDQEHVDASELQRILVPNETTPLPQRQRRTIAAQVVTPDNTDNGKLDPQQDDDRMDQDDSFTIGNEKQSDEEEDWLPSESLDPNGWPTEKQTSTAHHALFDEEDEMDRKPAAKKRSSNPSKKQAARRSSKKKKKPLPPTAVPPRSVAAIGLPVGSRAVGRGGLEIRSLDGVLPLLTPVVLKRATQLIQKGQYQAAANLCQHDEPHTIRALCQAAWAKLGLDTETMLEAGLELSEKGLARLEEGTKGLAGSLPGRFVVVRLGNAQSEVTGQRLVPLELADFVGTADEFNAAVGESVVTYGMEVVGDPSFGSLDAMHKRLDSAGLLPSEDTRRGWSPFMVTIDWEGDDSLPKGTWGVYSPSVCNDTDVVYQWALIEAASRDAPSAVLRVSSALLETFSSDDICHGGLPKSANNSHLIPVLSPEVEHVHLPASLLQKAIRRNFCSPAPLLEACSHLLRGQSIGKDTCEKQAPPHGGVFALLSTTWRGMLEDASPFKAPNDDSMLGFEELLLLSLIAAADPTWMLPEPLIGKVIATVVRTQKQGANFDNIKQTSHSSKSRWKLSTSNNELQSALQIMHAAVGGKLVHRSYLDESKEITTEEALLVEHFVAGTMPTPPEQRLNHLDAECRLAACDPFISPSILILVQASLPAAPTHWKKHSLPAIAKHVKKLIVDVNARMPDLHKLTRLAAWGNNRSAIPVVEVQQDTGIIQHCASARDVVTSTGVLSQKEHEIIDCFEAIQYWREKESNPAQKKTDATLDSNSAAMGSFTPAEIGLAPTEHDGRIAFLLAFAKSEEIEVCPLDGKNEVVNALFCGDKEEPLLVQRIGKARKEACTTEMQPVAGLSSGAESVPSLGYVQRAHSPHLVAAAELALAERWKGGRVVSLPLAPPGFQWKLPGTKRGLEEEAEKSVRLTAVLEQGKWSFSIGGVVVNPFDARLVISPCSLRTQNHSPIDLGVGHKGLVRVALYHERNVAPSTLLETLHELHSIAAEARRRGVNEGTVFDWMSLASTTCGITPTVWRDAILAVKTREREDVRIGPVAPDGTCTRDLTEGCLLRIFYVLESLYPSALIKNGALRWRVRQRGAGFYHMMDCLEQLSRGICPRAKEGPSDVKQGEEADNNQIAEERLVRHSKRRAARACSSAVASMAKFELENGDSSMVPSERNNGSMRRIEEGDDNYLPLPLVTTKLWPHQEASVTKVMQGVRQGRRGHADASAVGAGKTLTALATIVRVSEYMNEIGAKRSGILVLLPTVALVKEWLLQIAEHTSGFHTVEQREDGQMFSLTYGKSSPPIDANTIVISTLDRVAKHPFVRQAAWDFVVIDECLSVQNADAKRVPSAWRQIEISSLGVLMLSATFFRSRYSDLFYMIRMLRTAFPRSMEWLSATIHEHIVCQVPETDRTWQMTGLPVALPPSDLADYRKIIDAFKRNQVNTAFKAPDGRQLFVRLQRFLRSKYEGRETEHTYFKSSVLASACVDACNGLLADGYRPLVFADTASEANHLLNVLRSKELHAQKWSDIARDGISGGHGTGGGSNRNVIVAVKSVEGQGINMQGFADAIVCRPTPGDHLEQMKGRIDRPGQTTKKLKLVVLMAEHTYEEAKFSNIHLAGNFFREYIAPVASRYRERIDLEATLAAGGTKKLKRGTVTGAWRQSLEAAGRSGTFARLPTTPTAPAENADDRSTAARTTKRSRSDSDGKASSVNTKATKGQNVGNAEPRFAPLNKVRRNKGDPEAIRQAKDAAKNGKASLAIRQWLFPLKKASKRTGLAKESYLRFSDAKPPVVLDQDTVHAAIESLSKDSNLATLIARVGPDALLGHRWEAHELTQESLCDCCLRAITFTMVSVHAGNAFMRKLAMKIACSLEKLPIPARNELLTETLERMQFGGESDSLTTEELFQMFLDGKTGELMFTPKLLGVLIDDCLVVDGEKTGYPHLCGVTFPCGKNDDHALFLQKARNHLENGGEPVSAGYSKPKADFIVALVNDLNSGKVTAEKIRNASDREAAKMLRGLKGIGDWCAGGILMNFLKRADIMLYGDLTVRNYLNDLYDISHNTASEAKVESSADFPDTAENRNLIDALAEKNNWGPYRTVVCLLMYHLQEENLVLV